MKVNYKFIVILCVAVISGLLIAWIDSRPNWDDTGITAAMIVFVSALISFIYPRRPYIWALAVSCWIPLFAIVKSMDFSMLLIILFGFIGAYGGLYIYNLIFNKNKKSKL
jgi:hypothetical protein